MTVSPFQYVSGNPDELVGGGPASMGDIQGPFYDLRAYLNTAIVPGLSALSPAQQVMAATPVLDVGMLNQVRAGRQLTVADFTSIGLAQPVGLWNLTDLTNLGSDGRALANKGAVPFGPGINGVAGTSAVFAGSTGQALYIPDSGAADPFRIKTGSWGGWFRTAKRTDQGVLGKWGAGGQRIFAFATSATNTVAMTAYIDGATGVTATGVSDVCDDRWHFAVGSHDGTTVRTYVDGVLEASAAVSGPMFAGTSPLNIGGLSADAGTAATLPFYGRVDEAFVTGDVLTEDQIRSLYAAKLAHTLGSIPSTARLNVRRRRKGGPLATTDFPAVPVRLHNFTAGSLADEGTGGIALTNDGAAVSVAGADGTPGGAFSFSGVATSHLRATDAGLPQGTNTRSYGCWFKTTGTGTFIGWGTVVAGDARMWLSAGALIASSAGDNLGGPYVADGQWHFAVVVEDNAAGDGVRRKLYLDGRLVAGTTVMNGITGTPGANRFRIGAAPDGSALFTGQVDGAFICAGLGTATGPGLTAADVAALWAKGSQDLGASPKNPGDHVERMDATSVLFIGDTLESQHTVDLAVVS